MLLRDGEGRECRGIVLEATNKGDGSVWIAVGPLKNWVQYFQQNDPGEATL
jgi:hypothetical protein